MRGLICALFIGALLAVAHAVDRPDWAFPVADKIEPPSKDDSQPKTVTGSPNPTFPTGPLILEFFRENASRFKGR
jgi:hypothetical protein